MTRNALLAALAAATFVTAASPAFAVSGAVRAACAGDYFSHCSQHAVGSPGVRKCMRAVGSRLSKGCINALVASGEVSKAYVDARRKKTVAAK